MNSRGLAYQAHSLLIRNWNPHKRSLGKNFTSSGWLIVALATLFAGLALVFVVSAGADSAHEIPATQGGTLMAADFGGTDVNLITGTETYPKVTQSTSSVWGHGNTIVVAYNDSRGSSSSPRNICGVSVSTDGGATFTRLTTSDGNSPFPGCGGDVSLIYSRRAARWYMSSFAGNCNGLVGLRQWISSNPSDPSSWQSDACIVSNLSAAIPTMWVDNNPASPFYGRQYAAFNNGSLQQAPPSVVRSTDDGATWSAPVSLPSTISTVRRAVKITGSLGADGTVFVQTQNEMFGGLTQRQNIIYRSTDGGVNWTEITQNTFDVAGRSACSSNFFFPCMYSSPAHWRAVGPGQPGVGPNGVVHYVYAARVPTSGDPGNIYYIRSTDNGSTWSPPVKLNTDATLRAQWGPSLSVNAAGQVFVSWYDERNTADRSLQRYGRVSHDNGATWGAESAVSDVVFPVPTQPDPSIISDYVDFYNHAIFSDDGYGSVAYHTWTDGRVSINGSPQQDVFFDRIDLLQPLPITSGAALLINESCQPGNAAIDPGERVTVNFELINTGSAATSNLIATLQSSGGLLAPSAPQSYGAIAVSSSAARDFSFTAEGGLTSGQTITATLQLQDGTTNLGTVSFNFTAGPAPCSFVRLVVTSSLSRADASTVVGAITVQNIGSLPANDVTLTTAKLGTTIGTPLPQAVGSLAPGASASVTVNFNNSTPGASSTLTVSGTYSGGSFSSNKRVTIP